MTIDPDYYTFERRGSIYLVQTDEMYEAPTRVEAHLTEKGAVERVLVLNAYAEQAPTCPNVEDADDVWEAYNKAADAWRAGHPLGAEFAAYGYLQQTYTYVAVPLAHISAADSRTQTTQSDPK